MKKIAIVVGHSKKSQGAVNYKNETEFQFNSRIALKLVQRLNSFYDFEAVKFSRTNESRKDIAESVVKYKPDLILELHFNSFPKPISGCEALALKDDIESIRLADLVTNRISANALINQRHRRKYTDGVLLVSKFGRGYKNLMYYRKGNCPAVIVEPCFANFETEDSKAIFEDETKYVNSLIESISNYFNIEPKFKEKEVYSKTPNGFLNCIIRFFKSIFD